MSRYKEVLDRDNHQCYICGYKPVQVHHIFFGAERRFSDKYEECMVALCIRCHQKAHSDKNFNLELRKMAQERFEDKYSHDRFMRECGRNYL
jgi:5-methylcytosine-specific restriction endonuclease McrA